MTPTRRICDPRESTLKPIIHAESADGDNQPQLTAASTCALSEQDHGAPEEAERFTQTSSHMARNMHPDVDIGATQKYGFHMEAASVADTPYGRSLGFPLWPTGWLYMEFVVTDTGAQKHQRPALQTSGTLSPGSFIEDDSCYRLLPALAWNPCFHSPMAALCHPVNALEVTSRSQTR
jgi:hypothetical protein